MKDKIKIWWILFAVLFIALIILIPKSKSKQKYKSGSPISTTLPYNFRTEKAERLSIMAFDLRKEKKYNEAINLYRQAINKEPDNPRLFFDLSECYTSTNNPEKAISLLDTAIILDSSCAAFYNNRGLIYWHLYKDENAINDYKKAIQLDSSKWYFYSNLSLAYYANKKVLDACKMFKIAKRLGLDITLKETDQNLKKIEKICR